MESSDATSWLHLGTGVTSEWAIEACPVAPVPTQLSFLPYVPCGASGWSSRLECLGPLASPQAPWEPTVWEGVTNITVTKLNIIIMATTKALISHSPCSKHLVKQMYTISLHSSKHLLDCLPPPLVVEAAKWVVVNYWDTHILRGRHMPPRGQKNPIILMYKTQIYI